MCEAVCAASRRALTTVQRAVCWDADAAGMPLFSCLCKPLWGLDAVRAARACRITCAIMLASLMSYVPVINAKYPLAPWSAVTVGMVSDDRVGSSFHISMVGAVARD